MSLRALAKVRNFNDFVMYLTLFPSLRYVEKLLRDCHSALDLGFGEATWLHFVPFDGANVQIEGLKAALRLNSAARIHDSHTMDEVRSLALKASFVDAVLCLDVIEHSSKEDSKELLELIQSMARRVVVVSLPNGFLVQTHEDGNPQHRCGWDAAELRTQGFEVHGIMGLKDLRGAHGIIRGKPHLFWWLRSKFSEAYVWNRPERAFALLAIKKKK